jgi:hypothetical protein
MVEPTRSLYGSFLIDYRHTGTHEEWRETYSPLNSINAIAEITNSPRKKDNYSKWNENGAYR